MTARIEPDLAAAAAILGEPVANGRGRDAQLRRYDQVVRLYEAGWSTVDISPLYGLTRARIAMILAEQGVRPRHNTASVGKRDRVGAAS